MPIKTIPQQNALEVRMTGEVDAIQVEGFALLEVGTGIYRDKAWNYRVFAGGLRLEDQPWPTVRNAEGMVDHFHVVALTKIVHSGGAGQVIVTVIVADSGCYFDQSVRRDQNAVVAFAVIDFNVAREARLQVADRGGYCIPGTRRLGCDLLYLISH